MVAKLAALLLGVRSASEVVEEHGPLVYQHLRRIFGPGADIDDVFQAVCVEVVRSLPSYRGRASLATWIRRITWNVAYEEMRLHYREAPLTPLEVAEAGAPLAAPGDDPEAAYARQEALEHLYAALATLPPKERLAVVLHDIEGRKLREISEATGSPVPTVASQLQSGRARLTEWMQEHAAGKRAGVAPPVAGKPRSGGETGGAR